MANLITQSAGLTFNVNNIKKNIEDYYKTQGLTRPKFNKSHIAITACLESICKYLLKNVLQITHEDISGIKKVTLGLLKLSLEPNSNFRTYFSPKVTERYIKSNIYSKQLSVKDSEMKNIFTSLDNKLFLTDQALNLLYFLMYELYVDLLRCSNVLMEYANKKSLTYKAVLCSLDILFRDSEDMHGAIKTDVTRALENMINDKDDDGEEESGENQENNQENNQDQEDQDQEDQDQEQDQEPENPEPEEPVKQEVQHIPVVEQVVEKLVEVVEEQPDKKNIKITKKRTARK